MAFVDIELKTIKSEVPEEEISKETTNEKMIVISKDGSIEESLDENWDQQKQSSNENATLLSDPEMLSGRDSQGSSLKSRLIYFVDVFFSAFVSSPVSGFFWYTIWKFTEDFVYIYSQSFSYFICYFTGFLVLALAYLLQSYLEKLYQFLENVACFNRILCFLMRTCYMWIICVAVTIEWQGLWDLIESNIDSLQTKLSLSVIAITYACLTRSTRALVSTPFILIIDQTENFFEYELKSNSIIEDSIFANFVLSEVIDCLVMVVGWIGFDNFFNFYFDSYLSPEISYYSLLLTFTISHAVYFVIAFLQYPIYKLVHEYTFIIRLIAEHLVNTIMFITTILLWKFYWDLGDFFLEDVSKSKALLAYLSGNLLMFVIAVGLRITWVLVGPGVITFDGDRDEKMAYFDITYFAQLLEVNHNKTVSGIDRTECTR